MQPTPMSVLPRRKRQRPVSVKAEDKADGQWPSENEDELPPTRRKMRLTRAKTEEKADAKAVDDMVEVMRAQEPTTATMETEIEMAPLDRPFRGKCLYQSRKCENERALKRNGKAHNLCDEHRSKQNQHQRKFDAKKYSKRKPDGSSGDEDDHENEPETRGDDKSGSVAGSRGKASPAASVTTDAPRPASIKAPRRLETKSLSEGATTSFTRQYSGASEAMPRPYFHGSSQLDPRRPPPLQLVRTPPASFNDGLAQRTPLNAEVYSSAELLAAGMLVPAHARLRPTTYASPRGTVTPLAALARPSMRSQSFDSGITRISPVGGAALGVGGLQPFDRQQQFLHDQDRNHQQQRYYQHTASALAPSHGVTSPKLPSLQQLPLAQPTFGANRGLPLSGNNQYRHSPPYYAPQVDSRHAMLQPPPPPPRGPLLPPLAPLLQPPPQHDRSPSGHQSYRAHEPHTYEGRHQ